MNGQLFTDLLLPIQHSYTIGNGVTGMLYSNVFKKDHTHSHQIPAFPILLQLQVQFTFANVGLPKKRLHGSDLH